MSYNQQQSPDEKNVQPVAHPGMNRDLRNVNNIPKDDKGDRAWSYGFWDCFGECGTCVFAACLPCMLYSKNKSRLEHLERRNEPHPSGGDMFGGDCCLHAALTWCGCGWALQMGVRSRMRSRYRISGGGCGDCCAGFLCTPCELTQGSREIELEENALRGQY